MGDDLLCDPPGVALNAGLIELHAAVEQSEDPWAREIEREIWAALRASTVRRALATNPF